MDDDELSADEVWTPGHAGAALRGLVTQVAAGTTDHVYIGDDGKPLVVLLSYATYHALMDRYENVDAALTAQARVDTAPPPGRGLTTEELLTQVTAEDAGLAALMGDEQPNGNQ